MAHELEGKQYISRDEYKLVDIAHSANQGLIFGTWMVECDDLRLAAFPPLVFMNDIDLKRMRHDDIVHVFGAHFRPAPKGTTPLCDSFHGLNREDFQRLMTHIDAPHIRPITSLLKRIETAMAHENNPSPKIKGGRLLTPAEWAEVSPPFASIKVDYSQWGEIEYDIALKWVLRKATGWVYFSQKRFVFEKTEDYMLFKMWADNRPMTDSDVEVE